MSEFGGFRKHEKTQLALVGLGDVALAAVVALPGQGGLNFPNVMNKVFKKTERKHFVQIESSPSIPIRTPSVVFSLSFPVVVMPRLQGSTTSSKSAVFISFFLW